MVPFFIFSMIIVAGCSSAPKYTVIDNSAIPSTAKIGVVEQIKCISQCTTPDDPKNFTETLRVRLEDLLRRPVTVVPAITKIDQYGYYTPDAIAEVGKARGVDFVVDAQLSTYQDPSSGSRAGAAVATTASATAALAMSTVLTAATGLPIMTTYNNSLTVPMVSAYVSVVRTADAKLIGEWRPNQIGGNFSKCTSLTADIADMIYDKQFGAQ